MGTGAFQLPGGLLNHRYNFDYEVHRLNVKDRAAAARALCSNDALSRRWRFNFVRDAPDVVVYMHAVRTELHMKMVMPTVVGSSGEEPFLGMARCEWGPNGHGHFHGIAYGHGNPRIVCIRMDELKAGGKPSTWLPPGRLVELFSSQKITI